ncbi:MAG: alpha/beta hydrolase [Cyanobacteria bacterium REEB459]|nr:alpha/beta hydrolase [Cyanobacteria bacterium REEB459]
MKTWILTTLICLSGLAPARAATEIVLKYQGFSRSIPIVDLVDLSQTGTPSAALTTVLNQAGLAPEELRSQLIYPVSADPVLLDRVLNSWPGEWILDQLATSVHPAAGVARRQALRSALVLAATPANQLTLIGILQTYPTEVVVLEGDDIGRVYSQVGTLLDSLTSLWSLKLGKPTPSPPPPQLLKR